MNYNQVKVEWHGIVQSVQPRTTVWRYMLDNRTHSHIGYNIFLAGDVDEEPRSFSVAISEKQYQNSLFHIGDEVKGTAWTKQYDISEYADYYRAGALKLIKAAERDDIKPPPWTITAPDMATYERRGARMLSISCWKGKCFPCVFANMAAVAIEYNWGITQKHRFESFCYGPVSCKYYKMGKARSVSYKDRGTDYDTGWLDELCIEGRGVDEYEL